MGISWHFTNMVMCGTGCHEVEDYSSSSAQISPRGERSPSPREERSPMQERDGGDGVGYSSDAMVACFGELLIDFVPTIGGLSLAGAPAFKKAPGGAPANVACGIAKLGSRAAFLGKVKNAPTSNLYLSLVL
jgi:fructokinase